jgi:hypothetical protein
MREDPSRREGVVPVEQRPIDPAEIPAPKGGRESSKWKKAVEAFVEGGNAAEEIFSDADSRRAATGLTTAVKAMREEATVKVIKRGDRVFLMRKD